MNQFPSIIRLFFLPAILLALVALSPSCGTKSSVDGPQFQRLQPRKSAGVVYFYIAPYATMTFMLGTMIWDENDKDIVYLKKGGYFPFECSVGDHVFSTKHVPLITGKVDRFPLKVEAGKTYYITLKNRNGSELKLVDSTIGQNEIRQCNLLPPE